MKTYYAYKHVFSNAHNQPDMWVRIEKFIQADTVEQAAETFEPKDLGRYMILGHHQGSTPEVLLITARVEVVLG